MARQVPAERTLWEVSGYVEIAKLGEHEGDFMSLPFTLYYATSGEFPSTGEIQIDAEGIANDFLRMLSDTVPGHRGDYGGILNVDIASVHIVER